MEKTLNRFTTKKELLKISKIISWNLWQMDGLTYAIPYQKARNDTAQSDFVNFKEDDEESLCIIKDWRARKKVVFRDLLNRGGDNE